MRVREEKRTIDLAFNRSAHNEQQYVLSDDFVFLLFFLFILPFLSDLGILGLKKKENPIQI